MTQTTAKPLPLYPGYDELNQLDLRDYPELGRFLDETAETWRKKQWLWGKEYLEYIGRNKSVHTFLRFRNEVERFLLWSSLVKQVPMEQLRKADILEYADFCWHPPTGWIGHGNHDKFLLQGGLFLSNPHWAPFKVQAPKNSDPDFVVDKKKYKPSQQTLTATFTAIISFYNYLINEDHLYGNPAQAAKRDCRHFIKDSQVKEVRRLTEAQWQYVFQVALQQANEDPLFERSLFVVCALKTLFLRVSELSERADWSPVMSHFREDADNNWWLKVLGKGRKLREITVPPDFLDFLKRYRRHRGLGPLPSPGDNQPIVEKIRGQGGMTARQLTRIIQDVFDAAHEKMAKEEGADAARKLKEASTHWLRHTGASMEVERGRALKDLSEDLGHGSMATTDTIYVQTESRIRAQSGKSRRVK